jgi:DMSO/TMAO reductase YedYZ molybdopterin-dependent catalytic subunit
MGCGLFGKLYRLQPESRKGTSMDNISISRRGLLKGGALTGLSMVSVAFPVSAFGQTDGDVIPWVDQPPPPPPSEVNDNLQVWESLDSWVTPTNRLFNVNHYGQPTMLEESTWRVDVGGLVARPQSLTLADIKAREQRDIYFTLECSGNNGFDWFSVAIGNARWKGTPLAPLLREAGILQDGVEVVFYGVDSGPVTIRDNVGILNGGKSGQTEMDGEGGLDLKITEQFARSMTLRDALHPDNLLCYEMNGEPLPAEHGSRYDSLRRVGLESQM